MERSPPQVRHNHFTAAAMAARNHAVDACRTISSSSVSAQPGLATVPEGRAMNASLSTGLPTMHYTAEPLVPTEDLSNMSVEELQAELIRTRQAFHSAGARSLPVQAAVAIVMLLCVSRCCMLQHVLPCILVHVQSRWYPAAIRKNLFHLQLALWVCACLR